MKIGKETAVGRGGRLEFLLLLVRNTGATPFEHTRTHLHSMNSQLSNKRQCWIKYK